MLHEKYRPRDFASFAGNAKAVARLRRVIDRPDFAGDAFWIVGPGGTGKTSLAWIIARKFAGHDIDIVELDGEACTVDAVRAAAVTMHYSAMGGGMRIWIVNEAQAMTPRAVQAWLTTLDPPPPRTIVIFTTTDDSPDLFGQYAGPFRSRCKTVAFTNQGLAPLFAKRLVAVADLEGLNNRNGDALKTALRIVQREHNNMRAALQAVDNGELCEYRSET